jgi:hypothetical protein
MIQLDGTDNKKLRPTPFWVSPRRREGRCGLQPTFRCSTSSADRTRTPCRCRLLNIIQQDRTRHRSGAGEFASLPLGASSFGRRCWESRPTTRSSRSWIRGLSTGSCGGEADRANLSKQPRDTHSLRPRRQAGFCCSPTSLSRRMSSPPVLLGLAHVRREQPLTLSALRLTAYFADLPAAKLRSIVDRDPLRRAMGGYQPSPAELGSARCRSLGDDDFVTNPTRLGGLDLGSPTRSSSRWNRFGTLTPDPLDAVSLAVLPALFLCSSGWG